MTTSTKDALGPIHPGEILKEEFLAPLGISQYRLAKDLHVSPMRVSEIVRGERAITADTALRLSRYFGTSAEFWMGLQSQYDLEVASSTVGDKVEQEVAVYSA